MILKTMNYLIVFLMLFTFASAEEDTIFTKLKGIWENKDEKGNVTLIQFENDRIRICDDVGLNFYRAKYNKEKVWCFSESGPFAFDIKIINTGKFDLMNDGKLMPFTKTETPQPRLEIVPVVFGSEKPTAEEIKKIQDELIKRNKTDQEVRTKKELSSKMHEVDQDNTKYLKEVTAKYGWIDAERFGVSSELTAFLIVQHSGDIPLMLTAITYIEKDVKAKKIDGQDYALLYDRLNLFIGKKQKYGTQIGQGKNGPIVFPLEDKSKVEQFRKELGIFPLSQYLQFFEQGGKKASFQEDEIPKENK